MLSGYDYSPIFSKLKDLFAESDSVVANLETPIAGEAAGYTNERYRFNTPQAYLDAVRRAGIDTVLLANNHCMDRGEEGLFETLKTCKAFGLDTAGLNETATDSRILLKQVGDTKIAIINYTYGTNAFSHHTFLSEEHKYAVNLTQPEETLDGAIDLLTSEEKIRKKTDGIYGKSSGLSPIVQPYLERIRQDVTEAKKQAEVVIFCLHCGGQYNRTPDAYTQLLCKKIQEAGADLIVALHPHILQPCELRGDFLTAFCLGNCVYSPKATPASPPPVDESFSAILHTYISRGNGKAEIRKVTFSLVRLTALEGGLPAVHDTFSGDDKEEAVIEMANYFAGSQKYQKKQKEYVLFEK